MLFHEMVWNGSVISKQREKKQVILNVQIWSHFVANLRWSVTCKVWHWNRRGEENFLNVNFLLVFYNSYLYNFTSSLSFQCYLQCFLQLINPFTPTSDQDRISPYNINTVSSRQVMRIEKNINNGIISWSNTKFSELTP